MTSYGITEVNRIEQKIADLTVVQQEKLEDHQSGTSSGHMNV